MGKQLLASRAVGAVSAPQTVNRRGQPGGGAPSGVGLLGVSSEQGGGWFARQEGFPGSSWGDGGQSPSGLRWTVVAEGAGEQ